MDADPPINKNAPSLDEIKESMARLSGEKASGIYNISADFLKAGCEAILRGLHPDLTAM